MNAALVLAIAVLGLVVSVVLVALAAFKLPQFLLHLERNSVTSTSFAPVQVATTETLDMQQRPVPALDGVAPTAGMRVLLHKQFDPRENGIWVAPYADGAWTRAADLVNARHCVEGATVYVTGGATHRHATFVLRTLSARKRAPGDADIYFVPIMQHVLGQAHLPENQVLQVNRNGLVAWNTPDDVARQMLDTLRRRGWVADGTPRRVIPAKLHFLYGLWDTDALPEAWNANMAAWVARYPAFQAQLWNRERCGELLRSEFPAHVALHDAMPRAVMRADLMKWLILFHEGGYCVDLDTTPVPERDLDLTARMVLTVESRVSEHEAESLNRFEIRADAPCRATDRLGVHVVGAAARHPLIHFLLQHMARYAPRVGDSDYDVVFATGSDALTEVYDRYGRDFDDVRVVPSGDSFARHERVGSWKAKTAAPR